MCLNIIEMNQSQLIYQHDFLSENSGPINENNVWIG